MKGIGYLLLTALFVISCESPSQSQSGQDFYETEDFKKYWYNGLAELSSYDLTQSRYGDLHEGEAVLIFVTEDFSKSKQVKLDNPAEAPADVEKVLKLNSTRNFNTGIYPYSMMASVFSPVTLSESNHSLKTAASIQEWCGHTYAQLNRRKKSYEASLHSYFESEGDEERELDLTWLEDELWNMIRIDPSRLPVGNFKVIPGSFSLRLQHLPFEANEVQASLLEEEAAMTYTLNYPGPERTLEISFSKASPYQILGWKETTISRGKKLSTIAKLRKSMRLDYWNKNGVEDLPLRDSLMLK